MNLRFFNIEGPCLKILIKPQKKWQACDYSQNSDIKSQHIDISATYGNIVFKKKTFFGFRMV